MGLELDWEESIKITEMDGSGISEHGIPLDGCLYQYISSIRFDSALSMITNEKLCSGLEKTQYKSLMCNRFSIPLPTGPFGPHLFHVFEMKAWCSRDGRSSGTRQIVPRLPFPVSSNHLAPFLLIVHLYLHHFNYLAPCCPL